MRGTKKRQSLINQPNQIWASASAYKHRKRSRTMTTTTTTANSDKQTNQWKNGLFVCLAVCVDKKVCARVFVCIFRINICNIYGYTIWMRSGTEKRTKHYFFSDTFDSIRPFCSMQDNIFMWLAGVSNAFFFFFFCRSNWNTYTYGYCNASLWLSIYGKMDFGLSSIANIFMRSKLFISDELLRAMDKWYVICSNGWHIRAEWNQFTNIIEIICNQTKPNRTQYSTQLKLEMNTRVCTSFI